LQAAETARSAHRPTSDLSAYDLYLRALAMSPTPQAFQLLEAAIARDPDYGPALALAASWCMNLVSDGSAPDRDANRKKGIDFARRALTVAGNDPGVLADAAFALACFGEDINAMTALVDRALTFNPSYARGWHASSFLRLWAGQTDLAIEHAGIALRLSPRAQAVMSSLGDRRRAVLQPAFRGSGSETPRRDRGETHLPDSIPSSRGVLRPYGAAGRGTGDDCAASRAHARGDPDLPAPLPRPPAS